jgi:hypothetical protein
MQKNWIDITAILIQSASLIALVIYVVKTWEIASATRDATITSRRILEEMREARDQETRPYINIYFELVRNSILELVIKNEGRIQANEMNFAFAPDINCTDKEKLRKILGDNYNNISLHPGGEVRTYFDEVNRYVNSKSFPKVYKVSLSYINSITGIKYTDSIILDLSFYDGLLKIEEKGIPAIVDKLDEINDSLNKIISAFRK